MAELVKVVREKTGVQCQICRWSWTPKDMDKLPKRCANPDCRSMRWDATKYPGAQPPDPSNPPTEERFPRLPIIGHEEPLSRKPAVAVRRDDLRSMAHAA
jgi:hypothetical protein